MQQARFRRDGHDDGRSVDKLVNLRKRYGNGCDADHGTNNSLGLSAGIAAIAIAMAGRAHVRRHCHFDGHVACLNDRHSHPRGHEDHQDQCKYLLQTKAFHNGGKVTRDCGGFKHKVPDERKKRVHNPFESRILPPTSAWSPPTPAGVRGRTTWTMIIITIQIATAIIVPKVICLVALRTICRRARLRPLPRRELKSTTVFLNNFFLPDISPSEQRPIHLDCCLRRSVPMSRSFHANISNLFGGDRNGSIYRTGQT